mmetsp:Transcript_21871/g.46812  ORF Transcript_21871/g.46812 Transcript_21871/m.46812 type:complete len:276 (-) Transcript_21871:95-922(-)
MEELQDAIEDAQYVTAIAMGQDGPRPVLPWEIPEEEDLAKWKTDVLSGKSRASKPSKSKKKKKGSDGDIDSDNPKKLTPFEFEWTLAHALGFFLFSAYLKSDAVNDYYGINFMEEVMRWKNTRGRFRAEKTSFIVAEYLSPLSPEAEAEVRATMKARAEIPAPAPVPADDTPPPAPTENGEHGPLVEMVPPKNGPSAETVPSSRASTSVPAPTLGPKKNTNQRVGHGQGPDELNGGRSGGNSSQRRLDRKFRGGGRRGPQIDHGQGGQAAEIARV